MTDEVISLVQSVITIGAVLTVLMILLGYVLLKSSPTSYVPYYPGLAVFGVGIVLIVIATIAGKIVIMGAGLGGWGIACLFSSAIGLIITSILDAYASSPTTE